MLVGDFFLRVPLAILDVNRQGFGPHLDLSVIFVQGYYYQTPNSQVSGKGVFAVIVPRDSPPLGSEALRVVVD